MHNTCFILNSPAASRSCPKHGASASPEPRSRYQALDGRVSHYYAETRLEHTTAAGSSGPPTTLNGRSYQDLVAFTPEADWDPPDMPMAQRFTSRYRAKRYSFGYPACPNLEDQAGIWKLLKPQEIGVQLTEGFMMDPEASVSALVFHHPDCTYFSVGESPDA